ncbi:MAG: arylesterase [Deltaproteobacteria bacterium]|nr:arylesterase [Deltaproteobacteria bacterium]MBW2362852.1 arylesterase [Deltaproteobacteria bacterium]
MSVVWLRGALRYSLSALIACAFCGLLACEAERPEAGVPAPAAAAEDERPVVLFLGTSLTAGYGLPSDEAFPALIGERLAREGLDYRIVNAGVSGDTSAGGRRRLDWLLRMPLAVLVLELGANDMLRGLDVGALRDNLSAILSRTRGAYPEVRFVVAGMRAAPNLGADYARRFEAVYPELAQQFDAAFIPFLLAGVAGDPDSNLPDGLHPTAEGHRRVADTLWTELGPLLR